MRGYTVSSLTKQKEQSTAWLSSQATLRRRTLYFWPSTQKRNNGRRKKRRINHPNQLHLIPSSTDIFSRKPPKHPYYCLILWPMNLFLLLFNDGSSLSRPSKTWLTQQRHLCYQASSHPGNFGVKPGFSVVRGWITSPW